MAVSRYYRADSVKTYLHAAMNNIITEMTVSPDPNFPTSYPFTVIISRDQGDEEVVQVESLKSTTGDTITYNITRGSTVEPTMVPKPHNVSSTVEHGVSARDFRESRTHEATSTAVHGIAGAVVGTTDSQTLTNKTLGSGCTVPQSAVSGLSTALAGKAPLADPTFTGTTTCANLTVSTLANIVNATLTGTVNAGGATSVTLPTNTSIGNVSSTELGYLDGVTSAVQTQINTANTNITTANTNITTLQTTVAGKMNEPTTNGLAVRTASGTSTARSIVAGTGITVTNGDGVAGNITIAASGGTSGVTSVAGYTGVVTPSQLVSGISTADGSGSGLDADLLDGNHAAAFALASHTHTAQTVPILYSSSTSVTTSSSDANGYYGQTVVNISNVFTSAPRVVAVANSSVYNVAVGSVSHTGTTTSITLVARNIFGGSSSGSTTVTYICSNT